MTEPANSMENVSRKGDSREMSSVLWNANVHTALTSVPLLNPILGKMISVRNLGFSSIKINIIVQKGENNISVQAPFGNHINKFMYFKRNERLKTKKLFVQQASRVVRRR
jgi:hypothetical protein